MLKREPITDPTEAVLCAECVHYRTVKLADGTKRPICTGAMMMAEPRPDTFCSWGARRDG